MSNHAESLFQISDLYTKRNSDFEYEVCSCIGENKLIESGDDKICCFRTYQLLMNSAGLYNNTGHDHL